MSEQSKRKERLADAPPMPMFFVEHEVEGVKGRLRCFDHPQLTEWVQKYGCSECAGACDSGCDGNPF